MLYVFVTIRIDGNHLLKIIRQNFEGYKFLIPQIMPLSKGEMIDSAGALALDDPYSWILMREGYDHAKMHTLRQDAIGWAQKSRKWGSGNPHLLEAVERCLNMLVASSEVEPAQQALIEGAEGKGEGNDIGEPGAECWVQTSCPRLSIDWGYACRKPFLGPYEAIVALGGREMWKEIYAWTFKGKRGWGG
ncbi:hypothetical protein BDZ91DRAFT_771642 [Kalaharituber pfeilii]|nr:hypothetical protein BDZ91DRAFT_771642 [Kalaharituber pfeilii]